LAEHVGYTAAFWTVAAVNLVGVLLYFLRSRAFFFLHRVVMS
jgi:hypothetical protein